MKPAKLCTKKAVKASRYRNAHRFTPRYNRPGMRLPTYGQKEGMFTGLLGGMSLLKELAQRRRKPQGDK